MINLDEEDFILLSSYIKKTYGINLTQKKSLIEYRLRNIIIQMGFDNFHDYLDSVFSDTKGEQIKTLLNRLTTNHTYFMRERDHFDYFQNTVMPQLIKSNKNHDLRIWSAGCSTGEEPYTLAMILDEVLGSQKDLWDSKILATDISVRVLNEAKTGQYTKESLQSLPISWKLSYFDMIDKDLFEVKERIKKEVVFRIFNLMEEDFPFKKKFNVIFCRNVMIYFDNKDKNELINRFYEYMEDGGYLFIGLSEFINRNETDYKYLLPSIYRKG